MIIKIDILSLNLTNNFKIDNKVSKSRQDIG